MKPSIGWVTTTIEARMRQGAHGALEVRLQVLDDEGAPLPSYDGWSGLLRLHRDDGRAAVCEIDPDITGDAETQSLVVVVPFDSADTATLKPGRLVGDLVLEAPDGQRHFPATLRIDLERALAPEWTP